MKRLAIIALALATAGAGAFLWLTAPQRIDAALVTGLTGDATRGQQVFHIGGCASCHAPQGTEGEARLALGGGERFETPFGVFVAPNVSPGPEGIGGWSAVDFANAMQAGVAPDGRHYYPAFPYASYARMTPQDVVDLKAYMDGLPMHPAQNQPHELRFPFNIRRGLGLWKRAHLSDAPVIAVEETLERGRYLVEGPGHCAECHTPRDFTGGLDKARWMGGAPNPEGKGRIPNITPGALKWSAADIAEYLKSGFTPDYDSAGGSMAKVIRNTSLLSDDDRNAIAAYLKALPPIAE